MFPPSSSPLLLPQLEELVVPLHTAFTLTCQGEATIAWDVPLDVPEMTEEDNSGLFVTSISVDSATAMHTGYYKCFYRRNATEDTDKAMQSSIYVYVPGTAAAARLRRSRRLTSAHRDFSPFVSDPDVPFVPSVVPFGNHVLSDHEEMEIQCRVSDPSANVTLINVDTQQPVPCMYNSKRGAVGVFTAGTYVCKAVVNGKEHDSEEYIVHGWIGVCVRCSVIIWATCCQSFCILGQNCRCNNHQLLLLRGLRAAR